MAFEHFAEVLRVPEHHRAIHCQPLGVAADLADVAERGYVDHDDLWPIPRTAEIIAKPFELLGTDPRFLDDPAIACRGVAAVEYHKVPALVIEAVVRLP